MSRAAGEPGPGALPPQRLLFVDDDARFCALAREALSALGCEIVAAGSAEEALRRLLQDEFALVITDVRLPGLSGIELVTLMRERPRSRLTPAIFITGWGRDAVTAMSGYHAGGVDYLMKPVDLDVLKAKARVFLDLARARGLLEEALDDRRRAEETLKALLAEKELLLAEIHHRVKNNLQVICSVLALRADRLTDPAGRSVIDECQDRVRAIALLHEQIYREGHFGKVEMKAYLERLVAAWVASAGAHSRVRWAVRGAALSADLGVAIALAQIVSELLANVLKHAFPGEAGGSVVVELHAEGRSRRIAVSDDGRGLPAGFDPAASPGTLGMTIVSLLAKQIGARLAAEPRAPGARFTVQWEEKPA